MILGIDTTTATLALALRRPGEEPVRMHLHSERRHNETLLPAIESLLRENQTVPSDIRGVAVGVGPGSFTGVRIGIATAMGFAQSLTIPVIGVSSYLVFAAACGADRVLVVGDARQGMLYAAAYEKKNGCWQACLPEHLTTPDELAGRLPQGDWTLAGPDTACGLAALDGKVTGLYAAQTGATWPDPGMLIQLADHSVAGPVTDDFSLNGTPLASLAPIYLRRTQAEEVRDQALRKAQ